MSQKLVRHEVDFSRLPLLTEAQKASSSPWRTWRRARSIIATLRRSPTRFGKPLSVVGHRVYRKEAAPLLAIRLPREMDARLEPLAKANGRSKTSYSREAILAHLDDLEDLYLAKQRLIEIRAGKTETTPLEVVMKPYGVED